MIKIQVVLTQKIHVYRERSNSGTIFGSIPLTNHTLLSLDFLMLLFQFLYRKSTRKKEFFEV